MFAFDRDWKTYLFCRYERLHADHITKLPKGKHSTKGVGRMFPDPSGTRVMDDGMIIPMGKGRTEGDAGGSLQYNEFGSF